MTDNNKKIKVICQDCAKLLNLVQNPKGLWEFIGVCELCEEEKSPVMEAKYFNL